MDLIIGGAYQGKLTLAAREYGLTPGDICDLAAGEPVPGARCYIHLEELTRWLALSGTPVYFTIDLDCLDPSVFPGTGTPEAGGVTFPQLLEAIQLVAKTNVVGADVNELAPMLDISGVSTATACKVLRELLIALDKGWPGFQV